MKIEEQYAEFEYYKSRFPGCKYLEINARWREGNNPIESKVGKIFRYFIANKKRALDVGSGPRLFEKVLPKLGFKGVYYGCDSEPKYNPEYKDFLAINEPASFDLILMLELIEHMPLEQGVTFMQKAYSLLVPGGIMVLSTPNALHPNQVWCSHVMHVRPYPPADLYALLPMVGFGEGKIIVYRQYLKPHKNEGIKGVMWSFLVPVIKVQSYLLGLDWAQSLLVFAEK